ncbi:hypothetical protein BsWGS_28425 [Bradybaena similaris]
MTTLSVGLSLLSFCIVFLRANSQNCVEGWQYHEGSCYSFGNSPTTWGEAQAICQAYNGTLAEVETFAENQFLKNIARAKQAQVTYLGGTDMFAEGVWQWPSTGRKFSFVDWTAGDPDNYGGAQHCLVFHRDYNYQWDDDYCNRIGNFICEVIPSQRVVVG